MPFKSEKQRRYLWANEPGVARKWEDKYANGGPVMGILDNMNEETTITRKMADGTMVTVKSPKGSQVNMDGILGGQVSGYAPTPVADNKMINVTPGEYVVNQPAAQKYKPLLEKINNEGRQMLAQGGYIDGYALGGMTRERSDAEAASGLYGYATDSDPIVSSGNPAQMASEAATKFGLPFTDHVLEALEGLAMEVIADWGALPAYEQAEWGGMMELWDYYVKMAVEEGDIPVGYATGGAVLARDESDNLARVRRWLEELPLNQRERDLLTKRLGIGTGYAMGGEIHADTMAFAEELGVEITPEMQEKAMMIMQEMMDAPAGIVAAALAKEFDIDFTDYNLEKLEAIVMRNRGEEPAMEAPMMEQPMQGQNFWSGGEVEGQPSPGATPDEGDSITIRGQTVYFRNGQWVYASGSAAPAYVVSGINQMIQATSGSQGTEEAAGGAPAATGGASTGGLGLNATESKEAGWARRAIHAEGVIRGLFAAGFNPSSLETARAETFANFLGDLSRTPEGQRYHAAVKQFVEAALRKDTGAAIAADEFERTYASNFGSFATGQQAQADRGAHREAIIQGFIDASGAAASELSAEYEKAKAAGPSAPSAENTEVFSGQDIGGLIGGTIGAVGGAVLGGPFGGVAGGAAGTYAGRAIGQLLSEDDATIIDALTPEASDIIDTALGAIGGGIGTGAKAGLTAIKAAAGRAWLKAGGKMTAEQLAKEATLSAVAKKFGGGTVGRNIAERISPEILEQAAGNYKYLVGYGGKPFMKNAKGQIIDLTSGKAVRGKLAKDVLSALPQEAAKQTGTKTGSSAAGGYAMGGIIPM